MNIIDFRRRIFMKPTVFCGMLYPVCDALDVILNNSLNKGIKSVKHDIYSLYIEFKDGSKAELWNGNKYYAWLSNGSIGDFCWEGLRPRRATMRRLRYKIENYFRNK